MFQICCQSTEAAVCARADMCAKTALPGDSTLLHTQTVEHTNESHDRRGHAAHAMHAPAHCSFVSDVIRSSWVRAYELVCFSQLHHADTILPAAAPARKHTVTCKRRRVASEHT